MKIKAIYEKTVPIASQIRNAVIDFSQMTISVVAVVTDVIRNGKPVIGYGFNSNGRYAQGGILRERFIPRLLGADPQELLSDDGSNFDPFKCWRVMMQNEKPGGHGERSVAVGTLDMALWDLVAKIENKPLYRLLAERYNNGRCDTDVYVYAAGGYYYPNKDLAALQDEFRRYLDMGFTHCKMKIGGAPLQEDLRRIEAALKVLPGGNALMVDANGRFDIPTAIAYLEALQSFGLRWYEEPVNPLDYLALAAVAAASQMPIATGENIFSLIDSLNLIRYGGLVPQRDFLQMDPVLSYGLVEYLRILEMLRRHGWSSRCCIPHGGHLFGVHIAAGLQLYGNEAYPEVFLPFGKFAEGMELKDGKVTLPDEAGIGYERVPEIYDILRAL
ncbi:MAG: enolase C-terminal domain-like protein [candidate division KSB1 bacterium]|nr:enolase C-terminal domain-like protein [candidate division KSB1 bacterium]